MPQVTISPLHILRSTFGHMSFRGGQEEIVDAISSGRDVIAILPTGAGKSICYQVPALLESGPTLVVSPLIALMQDQVSALQRKGVAAVALTSTSSSRDRSLAVERLGKRQPSLVYVAPERLAAPSFRQLASRIVLSRIVVDEAHCISEWGHDFRPDYRSIGDFANLVGRPAIAAFTATATPATRTDIERQLILRCPVRIVHSVDRPNLRFEVVRSSSIHEGFSHISQAVRVRGDGAALVYVSTRALAVAVAAALRRSGQPAEAYHAGLPALRRELVQSSFLSAPRGVIVATCAFGMGIDHPTVRLVAHLGVPGALESYVQEAGRAGRDGLPARCLLIAGCDDLALHMKRLRSLGRSGRSRARARLLAMRGYVDEKLCRRAAIARWFGECPPCCRACDLCQATARLPKARQRKCTVANPD